MYNQIEQACSSNSTMLAGVSLVPMLSKLENERMICFFPGKMDG